MFGIRGNPQLVDIVLAGHPSPNDAFDQAALDVLRKCLGPALAVQLAMLGTPAESQ